MAPHRYDDAFSGNIIIAGQRRYADASSTLGEGLQDATYELGLVPEQPAEEWTSVVIDITDAHGERLHREWTYEEIATASDRVRAEANAPVVITYNEPPAMDRSEHGTGE